MLILCSCNVLSSVYALKMESFAYCSASARFAPAKSDNRFAHWAANSLPLTASFSDKPISSASFAYAYSLIFVSGPFSNSYSSSALCIDIPCFRNINATWFFICSTPSFNSFGEAQFIFMPKADKTTVWFPFSCVIPFSCMRFNVGLRMKNSFTCFAYSSGSIFVSLLISFTYIVLFSTFIPPLK